MLAQKRAAKARAAAEANAARTAGGPDTQPTRPAEVRGMFEPRGQVQGGAAAVSRPGPDGAQRGGAEAQGAREPRGRVQDGAAAVSRPGPDGAQRGGAEAQGAREPRGRVQDGAAATSRPGPDDARRGGAEPRPSRSASGQSALSAGPAEARRTDAADGRSEDRRAAEPTPSTDGGRGPQPLPTRQRPTSAPLGAATPQPSMLPPVQPDQRAANRPAADESRFAATAQAFTGAQAARARAAEQSEPAAAGRDSQDRGDGQERPAAAGNGSPAQRPAPGRSNVKDRDRVGQPPVDPRLSGPVPTAAQARAAQRPAPGQASVPPGAVGNGQHYEEPRVVRDAREARARAEESGGDAAQPAAAANGGAEPGTAAQQSETTAPQPETTEPRAVETEASDSSVSDTTAGQATSPAVAAAAPSTEHEGPAEPAAPTASATTVESTSADEQAASATSTEQATPADSAKSAAAATSGEQATAGGPDTSADAAGATEQDTSAEPDTPTEPATPREPGVRAAGIYTVPGREPQDQTQALGGADAPTLPGAPIPPAVLAAADEAPETPGGEAAPGRAARRQQQRSFGQAATAAALLESRGGNGGGQNGGGDDEDSGEAAGGRSKVRLAALIVAGVVVVLGIGYGVAYAVAGGSLARNATVAGIDVGGMTPEEAEETLAAQLPALVDQPFHLTLGDGETTYEVVPSAAGMTVDVPATVDAVPGGSANPISLVKALFGGGETTPVPAIDRAALETALTEIAAQADVEPVNGAVAFDAGTVVTSDPQPGRTVNLDTTIERLEDAFFGAESTLPIGDIELAVDEVQPAVSAEEVQRAVAEFAQPAMSAPVTVVAGEESVELPPDLVGQALTMAPDDAGTLQPALDGAKLTEVARDLLAEVGQEGRDATITIEGGAPVVVPAERGQGIAPETLSAALLPVLTAEGDARTATVELSEVDPELSTAAAEELGVTEIVAEFTTRFPHAEYRNVNIGTAAARIDNTLLLPGEEFSLNGIVGERTEANGFTTGTIIDGGRLEESLGGGVSQVATTTFHAAFLAGLEDVEHWPHSIYFDRYPIGQEATVAWGSKDMRFKNDTPYGVVVDTTFSRSSPGNQGTLNVKIWSTKYYTVETSVSERSNFTSPQTIYDTSDNCAAQGGSQGFSITSYRQVFTLDGTMVKDEADPWTYNPNHRVICGPDPGAGEGESDGED
ncbi:hypothetical protein C1I92_12065 [Jiangella anatolica]|uniref:YoaR-like putative peptidoglycan binding domain-containing protein n=1 Tax=Jiangella anatolica TaxID=2670374 RepID=A0A2W2BST5_9ACTN|nr:hypothetical protein C1I92_12065 [Jiangella anatolica]